MMNKVEKQSQGSRPPRESNIELLRILSMLLIVAVHYAVNSTVMWKLFDPIRPTANSIFMHLWGMWGKTAINVFVLITGYFMCVGKLTPRRYLKMFLEIYFYSWVMWFVLCIAGYETWSWHGTLEKLVCYNILTKMDHGFLPAFMWMYLLIPALNVYIRGVSKRNLYFTIGVLVAMFSICGTILNARVYHHVFWYATMYLVGAAIRKHPFGWMNDNRICLTALCLAVVASWISVIGIDMMAMWLGHKIRDPYFYVRNSHKILAFATGLFLFLVFRNWRIPQSRFINGVASTTFGVLLIHAASEGMRLWLWGDFVDVPHAYLTFSLPLLVAYSILVTVGVFAVCSALDYLRIRFVEKPIFGWLSLHFEL